MVGLWEHNLAQLIGKNWEINGSVCDLERLSARNVFYLYENCFMDGQKEENGPISRFRFFTLNFEK